MAKEIMETFRTVTEYLDHAGQSLHDAFQAWRRDNQKGYLLVFKSKSTALVHRHDCWHLGNTNWTEPEGLSSLTANRKVCSTDIVELLSWADQNDVKWKQCRHCDLPQVTRGLMIDTIKLKQYDGSNVTRSENENVAIDLPATPQGFMSSPATRKAIEEHAMKLAIQHFQRSGYNVVTRGKPFDLLCSRGNEKLYVEVKGTQGQGNEILLTRGEVEFHRDNPGSMALFVVSEIQVAADWQASGGTFLVKQPWVINENSLTPYAFSYRI